MISPYITSHKHTHAHRVETTAPMCFSEIWIFNAFLSPTVLCLLVGCPSIFPSQRQTSRHIHQAQIKTATSDVINRFRVNHHGTVRLRKMICIISIYDFQTLWTLHKHFQPTSQTYTHTNTPWQCAKISCCIWSLQKFLEVKLSASAWNRPF